MELTEVHPVFLALYFFYESWCSVVGSLPYRNSAQVVVGSMKYIFEYAMPMVWVGAISIKFNILHIIWNKCIYDDESLD